MKKTKKLHPMEELVKDEKKRGSEFIKMILKVVSHETEIPIEIIKSVTRKREIVTARQFAMTISSILTSASLAKVGAEVGGKDHATVLHARKTIFDLYDTDSQVKASVIRIMNVLCMYTSHELVCQICGSNEIQKKAWMDPNSHAFKGYPRSSSREDNYCRKCQTYVKFVSLSDFLVYDGQHTVETLSG